MQLVSEGGGWPAAGGKCAKTQRAGLHPPVALYSQPAAHIMSSVKEVEL